MGGSPQSMWERRDWLRPMNNNSTNPERIRVNVGLRGQLPHAGIQTLTVHVHAGRCLLQPLLLPPPRGIVRSAYVRKAKRTITPQCTSVLPGWATRSVSPRPPAARCPGSLHKAGGTSPGKLLPWWREKRVISFCFIRGWREKKKKEKKRKNSTWAGGEIAERFRSSSLRPNDNIPKLTLGRIDDFSALHLNGEWRTETWTGRYWGLATADGAILLFLFYKGMKKEKKQGRRLLSCWELICQSYWSITIDPASDKWGCACIYSWLCCYWYSPKYWQSTFCHKLLYIIIIIMDFDI